MTENFCLRKLKYCMEKHSFNGMSDFFADKCEYFSTTFGTVAQGRENVLNRLSETNKNIIAEGRSVYAYLMKIARTKEGNIYGVGKEGLLLAYDEEDSFGCAFFIELDNDCKIIKLVSSVEEYSFSLEKHRAFETIVSEKKEKFQFRNVTGTEVDWLEFFGWWLESGNVDCDLLYETFDDDCRLEDTFGELKNRKKYEVTNREKKFQEYLETVMNMFYYSDAHILWNKKKPILKYGGMTIEVKISVNKKLNYIKVIRNIVD
ncbi:MAG: hypothetical protein Q4E42_05540 [Phascolarctobacterium sp.]|nr:hypothetical protein [Phascolarctobacterium sp.]